MRNISILFIACFLLIPGMVSGQINDVAAELQTRSIAGKTAAGGNLPSILQQIRDLVPEIASPVPQPAEPATAEWRKAVDGQVQERRQIFIRRFSEAMAAFSSQKFSAARQLFVALHEDFPHASKPLYFSILCLKQEGEEKQAEQLARKFYKLLQLRQQREQFSLDLDADMAAMVGDTAAVSLDGMGRADAATRLEKLLERIRDLKPDISGIPDPLVEMNGADAKPAERLQHRIARGRRDDVRKGLQKGKKQLENQDLSGAFAAYAEVWNDHHNNLRAVYGMSLARKRQGRPDQAAELADGLLKILETRRTIRDLRDEMSPLLEVEDSGPLKVRFITYNVNFNSKPERVKKDVTVLAPRADVIMFQEAKNVRLRDFLGKEWVVHQVMKTDAEQGAAVAVRRSIIKQKLKEDLEFGVDNRGVKMHDRYMAWMDVELEGGRKLRLVSLHMPPKRFAQLQPPMVANLVKFVRSSPHPLVIGADWNFEVNKDPHGIQGKTGLKNRGLGIDGFYSSADVVHCQSMKKLTGLATVSDHKPVQMIARIKADSKKK